MELKEIDIRDFDSLFPQRHSVYDSARFNVLNGSKVQAMKAFALFGEGSNPLVGQIFGLRDGTWCAPFSAPFSVASTNGQGNRYVSHFYTAICRVINQPVRLVWSPDVYGVDIPSLQESRRTVDANFHYPLDRIKNGDYENFLSRSGRYNHHRALKHPFVFTETVDIPRAYAVIAANRQAMGYPLAMTLEQVMETVKIIPAHFFVMTLDEEDIAAAMIYDVAPSIAQVIYWGDLPHVRPYRAMNHLAFKVFEWYSVNRPDISLIDIGPASTDGVRNEGLCQFKLSVGCVETEKTTLLLNKN